MSGGKIRDPTITRFVYREQHPNLTTLLMRFALIALIILMIALIIYGWNEVTGEPHYKNTTTASGELTYIDCVYFTVISITTTGYGDIIPVTESAKVFDTIIITIGRAAVWFILLTTAYQFVYQRFRDVIRMKSIQKSLKEHVIVCGYETAGRTAAQELFAKGIPKSNIVIVTNDEHDSQEAADDGFVSLHGDATKQNTLTEAQIEKAKSILIATNRDDSNVLIALTAKDMNPNIRVVSQSNEMENVKLLKKSGADITISPLVTGGSLMATATQQSYVSDLLQDIMTAKHGVTLDERKVFPDEVGLKPKHLKHVIVFGVIRDGKKIDLEDMDRTKLTKGDVLLIVKKTGR